MEISGPWVEEVKDILRRWEPFHRGASAAVRLDNLYSHIYRVPVVMAVNSDGTAKCLGIAKVLEIGRSPKSGCTQALAYRLLDLLFEGSHRRRQLWYPEFLESPDRRGIHMLASTCKTKRRRRWCFVAPSMAKLVFFSKSWNLERRLSRFKISYLFWCDLLLFFGEWTISSHNVRGRWLLFRKG